MVGGGDDDNVTRQLVELHQQEGDNALDFARLMNVAAFLADRIELVEKKNARCRPRIFEEAGKARVRFAEIGADERVVANGQERDRDRFGQGFGERGFSIAGRAREENSVARLHPLGAQEIGAVLLLDQLARQLFCGQCKDEVVERSARLAFDDEVAAGGASPAQLARRRDRNRLERALQAICEDIVAFGAFLGDDGLDGGGQGGSVAGCAGLHQGHKEITSCHQP